MSGGGSWWVGGGFKNNTTKKAKYSYRKAKYKVYLLVIEQNIKENREI
jgi:hypothetical protein